MKRSGFKNKPRKPLKRTPFKRPTTLKTKRKGTQKPKPNVWAIYGLKKPPKPRFQGLQGVLWYVTSRYIRKSEFIQYKGECVDGCGRKIERWEEADCGHFRASSRGFCTRFVRENLGIQTKYCNNPTWSPDSAYGFSVTIDKRYGKGTAERLTKLSRQTCQEYSPNEYDREIRLYIKLFNEL